jgi:hypothetical protein
MTGLQWPVVCPLPPRACATACLQLVKADAASAVHPLANQLGCAIQCHRGTGTSPPPLRPLQCQPPIVLRPGPAPCPAVARTGRNLPCHCWGEYPPRHDHTTTISGRATNDPRQHACQRRAVARRVLLAVPPPGDLERRSVARSRASADIRPAHGVHPLRNPDDPPRVVFSVPPRGAARARFILRQPG